LAKVGRPLLNAESKSRNNMGKKSRLYLYPYCVVPIPKYTKEGTINRIMVKIAE